MDENYCVVQLVDHFLVIQDRTSKMVIGAGSRGSRTLYFCNLKLAAAVTTHDEKLFELWHNRMGHPSTKIVCSLPDFSISVSSELLNKACDVCPHAKQIRAFSD